MRIHLVAITAVVLSVTGSAQQAGPFDYTKRHVELAMRDGVHLQSVLVEPRTHAAPLPILLLRTPYGADDYSRPFPGDYLVDLANDGYVFVFQDIRGLNRSEGQFVM